MPIQSIAIPTECPYCGSKVKYRDSKVIYRSKSYGMVYVCSKYPKCDAYVGVHSGYNIPLGTMANRELRELRKKCHRIFDRIWKEGVMTRGETYHWLARAMKRRRKDTHFAWFNLKECLTAVKIVEHSLKAKGMMK